LSAPPRTGTIAVAALREGTAHPDVFRADPRRLRRRRGSPMAYWVGEKVLKLFNHISPLVSEDHVP